VGVRLSFEGKASHEPSRAQAPALPRVSLEGRNILKRIPFIGMRRTIADNLVASLQAGAHSRSFLKPT